MYLRVETKISPLKVGKLLFPDLAEDDFRYDIENQFEWLYLSINGFNKMLDITRDHGMSEIEDEVLEKMSSEEIEENLFVGPTYIFTVDDQNKIYYENIPSEIIQELSNTIKSPISIFSGSFHIENDDSKPKNRIQPNT